MKNQKFGMVLVPFPLTPVSVIAYQICLQVGAISAYTPVRFNRLPHRGANYLHFAEGFVLNLAHRYLSSELEEILRNSNSWQHYAVWKRFLNFFRSGAEKLDRFTHLMACMTMRYRKDPRELLQVLGSQIVNWVHAEVDPWLEFNNEIHMNMPTFEEDSLFPELRLPTDTWMERLPVFNPNKPHRTDADITGRAVIELREGQIKLLEGSGLVIAVGGEPGRGKSSLTASLIDAMEGIVTSLSTRRGWHSFKKFKVKAVNLDLGTPVMPAIMANVGQDREKLLAEKREWTPDLAIQAFMLLHEAKKGADIILADLPGKLDSYTETLASAVDAAILICHEWEELPPWQRVFEQMGTPVTGFVKSRQPEAGYQSVITKYEPGLSVRGRVINLDRTPHSYDVFIQWLAKFLLFDILPSILLREREALRKIINRKPASQ